MEIEQLNLRGDPRRAIRTLLAVEKQKTQKQLDALTEARQILPRISYAHKPVPAPKEKQWTPLPNINLGHEFKYIRDSAMTVFRYNLISRIKLFGASFTCSHHPEHTMAHIPSTIFSWSYKEFLKRYSNANLAFSLQLFRTSVPPECWEILKFQKDFRIFESWLELIFAKEHDSSADWDYKALIRDLNQDIAFLDIFPSLKKDVKHQYEKVQQQMDLLNKLDFTESEDKSKGVDKLLKEQVNNLDAWQPIEIRYQKKWLEAREYQFTLRCLNEKKAVLDEIEKNTSELNLSNYTTECCISATRMEISDLNKRYEEFRKQFDREYDEEDYRLSTIERNIQSMKEQRKSQERDMVQFQIEIDFILDRIEKEMEQVLEPKHVVVKRGCGAPSKKGKKKGK